MGAAIIEKTFPKIRKEGYRITSKDTTDYNCFAWVLDDTSNWWSPGSEKGYHWPVGIPRNLTVKSFEKLFEHEGEYVPCDHNRVEKGFEKIAIYADAEGNVRHAAKQTEDGKWSSKLGDWEDCEHNTLTALEGKFYGKVVQVLKRAAP